MQAPGMGARGDPNRAAMAMKGETGIAASGVGVMDSVAVKSTGATLSLSRGFPHRSMDDPDEMDGGGGVRS
jgi:hypothetical protein